MSLSRPRLRQAGFLLTACVLLAGCGFKPLYEKGSGQEHYVTAEFSKIEIKVIEDRVGQQLRNLLLDRLTPLGPPEKPVYVLSITVQESTSSLGVQKSAIATRANLNLKASYWLDLVKSKSSGLSNNNNLIVNTEVEDENTSLIDNLPSGDVRTISSYDLSSADFSNLVAVKNARANAAREIADGIKTRLAIYFKQAMRKR